MSHSTKPSRPATPLYLTAAGRALLQAPEGMALFLDVYFGLTNWVRDDEADRWIVPLGHDAEGRRFLIYEAGGDAHPFVLPVEAIQ